MTQSAAQQASEAETLFVEAERAEEKGLLEDAANFLMKAANLEHAGAQLNLGNSFSWGRGVPQSDLKAAYWYKRAYRNGDESGAFNLALDKLEEGKIRSAIFWFKRAVEMRSGEAAVELAKVYLSRPRGKTRAIELLRLTQTMKLSEISEQAKEDAALLLLTMSHSSPPVGWSGIQKSRVRDV